MESSESKGRRVGLIYDERMCKHSNPHKNEYHPENPHRIRSIWNKLHSAGIHNRCVIVDAKEADDKYLALVHTKKHIDLIKNISSKKLGSQRNTIASRFNSIYFNEGSTEAAYLAAGSVIEVAEKVAKGELNSAFAIVRPPGHHAEEHQPMGFCLYNNVGIATSFLLDKRPELGIKRILIVDWDVHHGNGNQKMFWKDPRVLFFSVHRHEFGSFYPAGDDGSHIMTGEGPGAGYNINVPWENARCGDADYLAVWDHVLIPVAKEFNPDLVIVSAGFDAAINDPLGGCCVTPSGFSVMLKKLMEFAGGRIVMALEGGYNLDSIANSVLACVEVLLDDKNITRTSKDYPFDSTWRVIKLVREELCPYWPTLAEKLPEKLNSRKAPQIQFHGSDSEDEYDDDLQRVESEENEKVVEDVIEPLLKLKVDEQFHDNLSSASPPWRSKLSKVDVWYATFGSNMSISRFLCYIEGGQTEGMRKKCSGSMDKSQPKETVWKTVPHRLFFGHDCTSTWGPGGVAFLHPESTEGDETHMCLYKITLEQFNDVLLQENTSNLDAKSPLFDLSDLHSVEDKQFISVEALKTGWYHNVVYLGKEKDIPILTMTCPVSDVESFKTGKLPLCQPCEEYASTLIRGLTEMPENESLTNGSKRRKVATPPPPSALGKETLPMADVRKHLSSPRSESTCQEYLPASANKHLSNLHENADLWDADTVKSRKAAMEVAKAFTSHVDLSRFKELGVVESSEMVALNLVRALACVQSLQEKCLQDAALVAESHAKISKLTQEVEEAQSEVKLEKINQEIAERLVEQARQEKYIVELESMGEKACLKRKIEELEMELQQQRDKFNNALSDAEVYGYNKCVKRAKEKGLRYKTLLLENSLVPPLAENLKDLENVPGSTKGIPIGTDSTATVPTVSSTEKALFDPADPINYRSMIELLAKKNLEDQVVGVVSKKGDNGTLKPTSSSLNISEKYKQLKDCKTELVRMKKAAFILGFKKCAEFIGEGNVFDPSKHSFKAFLASEVARLGISAPSSATTRRIETNKI